MVIGFDAKRAFRNSSGLGNYSRRLIHQLARFYPHNRYLLYTPNPISLENDFPPLNTETLTPPGSIARLAPSLWRSYSIMNNIIKDKPDIFHGLSNELPFSIEKTKVKSIVTIHDLIFIRYPEFYKKIDRKIYLKKFRFSAENADRVIAASEQTKKDIIQFLGIPKEKIHVVYQSGNPMFSSPVGEQKIRAIRKKYSLPEDYIFNLGTIEERKNLLQLLRALQLTKERYPLVVAGNPKPSYFGKVKRFIGENKSDNIFFLNRIPTNDLPALYQGAKLFVYPSSFEGFGIPVLEALQSGIPVIAGKGNCLEETGGPASIYIDPFDSEKFAVEIDRVMNDSELCRKMTREGLTYARKFEPQSTTENLMRLYEDVLR